MNQKIPTLIGTVIIIILAFAAGYFVWLTQKNNPIETQPQIVKANPIKKFDVPAQPTNETAHWQTYRNEKYNYSFLAPKNFSVTNGEENQSPVSKPLTEKDVFISGDYNNGDSTIISLNIGSHNLGDGKCLKGDFIKTVTIDGKNIEICKANGDDKKHFDFYSNIVRVDMFANISGKQEIFEKILSTLKFTN
jgi:hypothetical protein